LHLTHESKDAVAKNKHKYKRSDIKLINNFDIDRYITLDVEDKEDLFNEICDIIDDHDLANMRELKNFVKYHGAEYGLPSMKVIRSVMKMSSGIIRLTFDAVYQERRYGKQIDDETGEIK
ncbi:replication protein RepB, partial [Campylobacter jejuni]|nr:replication protein RepB [Campylobacter jejuni]